MNSESLIQMVWRIMPEEEEMILTFLEIENYRSSIYMEPSWNFSQIVVYVDDPHRKEKIRQNIDRWFVEAEQRGDITTIERYYQELVVKNEDWLDYWKKFFVPIPIGETLEIVPSWLPASDGKISLFLEPKMGFGTGQHESTYLCLKALEKEDLKGKRVLDIGAGSGILGVASALLGASHTTMIENDPLAIESCQDTVNRNHMQDFVSIVEGDVFEFPDSLKEPYDLALINIVAEVIVEILGLDWIGRIPILNLSGILKEKKQTVIQALKEYHWEIMREEELGAWVFFQVCKSR